MDVSVASANRPSNVRFLTADDKENINICELASQSMIMSESCAPPAKPRMFKSLLQKRSSDPAPAVDMSVDAETQRVSVIAHSGCDESMIFDDRQPNQTIRLATDVDVSMASHQTSRQPFQEVRSTQIPWWPRVDEFISRFRLDSPAICQSPETCQPPPRKQSPRNGIKPPTQPKPCN